MNAIPSIQRLHAALVAYYEQWHTLTLAEGDAIASGQWHQVEQLQETKRQLRHFIEGATRELRAECVTHGANAQEIEDEFRPLLQKLIALESRNGQALAAQYRQAREQAEGLEAASHKLRQLKHAYAPQPEALWQSYS